MEDPVGTARFGPAHPLARHIGDFLTDLGNANASAQTIRPYRGDLIQFAAHHDGEVGELSAVPVRAYLSGIGGLAAATRKRKRAAVASFCKWAVRHDLLGANPMDKIDSIKVPKSLPRPAAADDIKARAQIRSAAAVRARTSRWTGCATGCCSRPPTPAAPVPRRSAARPSCGPCSRARNLTWLTITGPRRTNRAGLRSPGSR